MVKWVRAICTEKRYRSVDVRTSAAENIGLRADQKNYILHARQRFGLPLKIYAHHAISQRKTIKTWIICFFFFFFIITHYIICLQRVQSFIRNGEFDRRVWNPMTGFSRAKPAVAFRYIAVLCNVKLPISLPPHLPAILWLVKNEWKQTLLPTNNDSFEVKKLIKSKLAILFRYTYTR